MRTTSLFGKTYVWVQATQTDQWRLSRVSDMTVQHEQPWADPDYGVLADIRASLTREAQS